MVIVIRTQPYGGSILQRTHEYYGQDSPLLRLDFKVGNVNGTYANKWAICYLVCSEVYHGFHSPLTCNRVIVTVHKI